MLNAIRISFAIAALACAANLARAQEPACQLTRGTTAFALDQLAYVKVKDLSCAPAAPRKGLWFDGMDTGVRSIGCDDAQKFLVFRVTREQAGAGTPSAQTWNALLSNPFGTGAKNNYERDVSVILKDEGGANPFVCAPAKLQVLDPTLLWLGGGLVVVVLAGLFLLSRNSDLLRDSGPFEGSGERPFSLARVQMAWWFVIVFACYILLWLVTHGLPVMSASALWLIGIASVTAVSASAVDSGKKEAVQPSAGFWRDILTNANGVTLYRFQNLAWTVLFGVVFVSQVLAKLAMPEFDNSVLVLMGLSAGAYLGFKVPETHVNQPAAAGAPPAPDLKAGYTPSP